MEVSLTLGEDRAERESISIISLAVTGEGRRCKRNCTAFGYKKGKIGRKEPIQSFSTPI